MTSDLSTVHPAVPATDEAAIRATIDDYYLGWFDADGERMARALHPELAKRGWRHRADGLFLDVDTFATMTDAAALGHGRQTDPAGRGYTVRIDDVDGDIATATVHSVPYVDYLHLIRTSDGWRIVNALWCPA
jgi:putative lumazine-binding protein